MFSVHVLNPVNKMLTGITVTGIVFASLMFAGVQSSEKQPARIISHLSSMQTVVVQEGNMVELVCNVTGVPKPTVNWYRIHKAWRNQRKERIGVSGEVLRIDTVSRNSDGEYECVAYNGVPPADSRKIRVTVEFPPEVRMPNRRIGQSKGKSTILDCAVTAYPHGITVWRRNGQDIERNSKYDIEVYNDDFNMLTVSLRIHSVEEADYGQYQCVSVNYLGKDSETVILYEISRRKTTTTTTTTIPRAQTTHAVHYRPPNKGPVPDSEWQPRVVPDQAGDDELNGNLKDLYNRHSNGNGKRNQQGIYSGSGATIASSLMMVLLAAIVSLALQR